MDGAGLCFPKSEQGSTFASTENRFALTFGRLGIQLLALHPTRPKSGLLGAPAMG